MASYFLIIRYGATIGVKVEIANGMAPDNWSDIYSLSNNFGTNNKVLFMLSSNF